MRHRDITPEMFEDISYPHKEIADANVCKYRVYTDRSNYILVEATNAQQALDLSSIKNPVRIVRDGMYLQNVFVFGGTQSTETPIAPEQDNRPEQAATVAETAVNEETAAVTPTSETAAPEVKSGLSSDEVDKLLNTSGTES